MLFAHAGQDPNLAFARKFFDTFDVANLVGTPDQGNGLGAEALNFQQVQHGGAIFLQQLGVEGEPSFFKDLLHVQQHALADAGNFQHLFRFADDVSDLVGSMLVDRSGSRHTEIGRIEDVRQGVGAAPLLVVLQNGKEHEIPFAEEYVVRFDTAKKILEMRLPDGLLEVNASLSSEEKKRT